MAKGFRISTTFGSDGAVVRAGSGVSLQLGLEAVGRVHSLVEVGSAVPVGKLNTVSYSHFGIGEWYINGPLGLEQGFTVGRRPGGTGALVLVVGRVPDAARSDVGSRGTSLTVASTNRNGGVLRYSQLRVTDASGRHVPARIELRAGRILLQVRDKRARYPLRIDPVVEMGGAELTPSDANPVCANGGDCFGGSVAVSSDGSTVVVGATAGGAGAVYVFSEPASGGWQDTTETAKLTPSDGVNNDAFGASVAVSGDGDTIVVGSPHHDSDTGAVYVFSKPVTGGWQNATETAELTASDGTANDDFGASVAVSGDAGTIVSGAPSHTDGANAQGGAAYVFSKPASGGWQNTTETAELTPSSAVAYGEAGNSVATSDDGSTVVVGAPGFWVGTAAVPAVYVFAEPPSGGWQTTTTGATLTESSSPSYDRFGTHLAISGDASTLAVGAPGSGTYVLSQSASGGWQNAAVAQLWPNANGVTDPTAISDNGSKIIVGQVAYNSAGPGAADLFNEPASGGWQPAAGPTEELEGPYSNQIETQTASVAISGDGTTAVVGSGGGPVLVFPPVPVASSQPTISGSSRQGQTLIETNAVWSNDPTAFTYQWEDCNAPGPSCSPINGAIGQSYTVTNADAGDTIAVEETASNAGGPGNPVTSLPTTVVTPLAPTTSAVPTITGTAVEGNSLTASGLAWTNTPTSVSYQWEDCDSAGQVCQPITGATGKTYTLAARDIGDRIVVQESASNAGGTSQPKTSAATGAVPEAGPVGLEIDNGDYATNNPNVTIQAAWPPGTQSILIANNGGFRTNTETVAPAASIQWTLEQTAGDRLPKTVYVRFLGVGQDDINFTDDIILDETAPTVQSATVSGPGRIQASAARAPRLKTYKLRLRAKDQLVGVCEAATNHSRATSGEVLTTLTSCKKRGILKVSRTLNLKLRAAPRYVRVRNSAGDWSRWFAVKS